MLIEETTDLFAIIAVMVHTEILERCVRSLFAATCDAVTTHCVREVVSGYGPILYGVASSCRETNIDMTRNYAYINLKMLNDLFGNRSVMHELHRNFETIQEQTRHEHSISGKAWSTSDLHEMNSRLYHMRMAMQNNLTEIAKAALMEQNISCQGTDSAWLVPFPIQITHTEDFDFLAHYLVLHQMVTTKDNRQERSTLCIIFILLIFLAWMIVVALLVHHYHLVKKRKLLAEKARQKSRVGRGKT